MADQHDRHEESLGTEQTRYERELDSEQSRRHEAAERLKEDPLPDSSDE